MEFDVLRFMVEGITDRDAPSLYGKVGERDLYRLWADKVDLEDSSRFWDEPVGATAEALGEAREKFPIPLRPCFVKNENQPFMRAIVDGGNFEQKTIARFVAQDGLGFDNCIDIRLRIRGERIPEQYWIELQHQMIVAGLEESHFVSVNGPLSRIVVVPYDPVFGSNHMAECILFWDHVRRGVPPKGAIIPPDVDQDSDEAQPLRSDEEHA